MCYGAVTNLPIVIREQYNSLTSNLSSNIFSMNDVAYDHMLKMTLLDYLIESRQIKKIIFGSTVFDQENNAQLFELYDRL